LSGTGDLAMPGTSARCDTLAHNTCATGGVTYLARLSLLC
jgi:hypothetical protein